MGEFILFLLIASIFFAVAILLFSKIIFTIKSFGQQKGIKAKIGTICFIIFFCYVMISMLNGIRASWEDRKFLWWQFNHAKPSTLMDWATSFGTD